MSNNLSRKIARQPNRVYQVRPKKKDTVPIYTIYLEMDPVYKVGVLFCVEEYVDETMYNFLINNRRISSKGDRGRVEVGHTHRDGIGIKIATAKINYVADNIDYIIELARKIIEHGLQGDKGFTSQPRVDLKPAFKNILILEEPQVLMELPSLSMIPRNNVDMHLNDPFIRDAYSRSRLLPKNTIGTYV